MGADVLLGVGRGNAGTKAGMGMGGTVFAADSIAVQTMTFTVFHGPLVFLMGMVGTGSSVSFLSSLWFFKKV